ncbi:MAG: PAS domain S-box protein [Actinobacteria bacterium]|nr:PAS domain S-box protein [Actinomycetota bacterium]
MKKNVQKGGEEATVSWFGGRLAVTPAVPADRACTRAAPGRDGDYLLSLLRHSPDIILVLGGDLKVRWASPSVARITGYGEEEMRDRDILSFLHPEDRGKAMQAIYFCATRFGVPYTLEIRFRNKDGAYRHHEAVVTNLLQDPVVQGVVVNSRDVTEAAHLREQVEEHRQRLEALVAERTRELEEANRRLREEIGEREALEHELQKRERYYRSLIENVYDLIAVIQLDGRIDFVSRSVTSLGYEQSALAGLNAFDFVHPEDLPRVLDLVAEGGAQDGFTALTTFRLRAADGSWRVLEAQGRNLTRDPVVRGAVINARDITERVKAEEALRESEEKFRILSEHSMLGIVILQDNRFRYMNRAAADIYGLPLEGYQGLDVAETINKVIHPEDREFILEQSRRKQLGEEGQVANYAFRVVTSNGETRWLEVYSKTIDYQGRPADMVALTDITGRKLAEEALLEKEEYFRSLVESSLDVIIIVDENNMLKYISLSVEEIFGYRPEELLGRLGLSFLPEDELISAGAEFSKVLKNPGMLSRGEFHARRKDGALRRVQVKARNMFDHPLVRGIMVNVRDVTEEWDIERRLEGINRLFLGLGADIIGNMEAILRGCRDLLEADFAAYCRLEAGRFSVLSTATGEEGFLVTGEDWDYLALGIIKEGGEEPLALQDLRADPRGEKDPLARRHGMVSFLGYPVRLKGRTVGCLCVYCARPRRCKAIDVETAGMLARALAVEEERLAGEQNLKNFVDVAAHELRHPVTVMKGYALTLRDYGERLDEGTRREYLEVISKGADRLDSLIRELLDASRIERGRFAVNREEQRLEPLLERAVQEVREKGIAHSLRLTVKGELAPREVDADKLVQVLVILMDNAVAHSPAHFPVEVEAEDRDGEALVSVLDRGVGVPEAQRELIFERFYQIEDAHHPAKGMGLGLYIAREIVEAHGGRIWHEPRLGGGSAFRFTLR